MIGDDWNAYYHRWRRIPERTKLALVECASNNGAGMFNTMSLNHFVRYQ